MIKNIDNIVLTAISGNEKYLRDTIKAVEYSSKDVRFPYTQILSNIKFNHDYIKCVEIPPINSSLEYSDFCVLHLHKYIDKDFMFLIQYDGFILDINKWKDEFLDYDYIGAPWPEFWCYYEVNPPITHSTRVGNGGCCIRSRKLLQLTPHICDIYSLHEPIEDAFICRTYKSLFEKLGCKFAPIELAADFSIEHEIEERPGQSNYKGNLESMCFHGAWSVYRRLLE